MSDFWVVDTKCKVLPQSALPQDGSDYYYGRSVVPAESKEVAIEKLASTLKDNDIVMETVLATVIYEDGSWDEDDDFEVQISFEEASNTRKIELGSFVSEKSLKRS